MYALVKYRSMQTVNGKSDSGRIVQIIKDDIGLTNIDTRQTKNWEDSRQIAYIEQEFEIELRGDLGEIPRVWDSQVLIAYLGVNAKRRETYSCYNLETSQWVSSRRSSPYVIGYSSKHKISSTRYLKFIIDMLYKALEEDKKLIIYADIYIQDSSLRYRSLLNRTVNKLLDEGKGILINKPYGSMAPYYKVSQKNFEPYIENTVYTTDEMGVALKKIKLLGIDKLHRISMKRQYREVQMINKIGLYKDIFYEQIADEEFIYVPILPTSSVPKEDYEKLGFQYIRIERDYGILRGPKKLFDSQREYLINNVVPQYMLQILTPAPLVKQSVPSDYEYTARALQDYNGEGVLIGIVGVEGVDYKQPSFIDEDGKSRISYMWKQVEGDRGTEYSQEYFTEQINSDKELTHYQGKGSYLSSILLDIAGGKSEFGSIAYQGIASKAEFVVAQVKSAPDILQSIYGGVPNEEAMLLDDLLIAIDKLVEFANQNQKPLVLCIPYGGNLGSHDGKSILETRIEIFASQPGVAMIMSTGEEADKNHHSRILLEDMQEYLIDLKVEENEQKVVGKLWSNSRNEIDVTLVSPSGQYYSLAETSKYIEEYSEILTTGISTDFDNGLEQILFSLQNPSIGKWTIIVKEKSRREDDKNIGIVDVWIAQQELNHSATLRPSCVFVTIPAVGNIPNVITIGNYDNDTLTVYKSSGRGYTRQNLINPMLVAQGKDILAITQPNEWGLVTGSLGSMANIAGVVAVLYSKILESKIEPIPNTVVIGSILINELTLLDTVQYPNPSQGNGILDKKALKRILNESITIKV